MNSLKNLFSVGTAMRLLTGKTKHYGFRAGQKDANDPAELEKRFSGLLDARDLQMKGLIEKAQADIDKTGQISASLKEELTAFAKKSSDLQEILNGLTQEIAGLKSAKPNSPEAQKSVGAQMSSDASFLDLVQKGRGTAIMKLKAVTNVTSATTGTGAAGAAIAPDRLPGILSPALRTLTIRDLLMPGRTSSNLIQYVQETGYQNMAAAVAEGALKPQSDLAFTLKDSPVRTLAHWLRASKQILADVPMLESYIDTRLTYGLKYVEEAEILNGDGTGEHLLGLIPQATAYNTALTKAGDTPIDTIRRAILQVRIAEYAASGIVLNPIDWANIELQKDSQGRYIWVNVTVGGIAQLWRLPVLDTNAIPVGHFLVGAFNMAAQVFDREDANVQVSTEDQDNFVKNMVTIRAEERLGMIVFRPEAIIYGAFVAPTT